MGKFQHRPRALNKVSYSTEMIVTKDLRVIERGESLFEKVSLVLRSGERVALDGSDAVAVTTLMRVLAGELEMDEGTVATTGERVAYVLPETLAGGADALARVFHTRPTFLLVNAIGTFSPESLKDIRRFIQSFRGGILISATDTSIVEEAKTTRAIELNAATKTISVYTGAYGDYLVEKEKRQAQLNEAYEKQQREKRRLEGWLEQKRKEATVDRSPEKGATIRAKAKYLQREILSKEIPNPSPGTENPSGSQDSV